MLTASPAADICTASSTRELAISNLPRAECGSVISPEAEVFLFFLFKQVVLVFTFALALFALATGLRLSVATRSATFAVATFFAVFFGRFASQRVVGFATHILEGKELVKAGIEGDFFVLGLSQHQGQSAL